MRYDGGGADGRERVLVGWRVIKTSNPGKTSANFNLLSKKSKIKYISCEQFVGLVRLGQHRVPYSELKDIHTKPALLVFTRQTWPKLNPQAHTTQKNISIFNSQLISRGFTPHNYFHQKRKSPVQTVCLFCSHNRRFY